MSAAAKRLVGGRTRHLMKLPSFAFPFGNDCFDLNAVRTQPRAARAVPVAGENAQAWLGLD